MAGSSQHQIHCSSRSQVARMLTPQGILVARLCDAKAEAERGSSGDKGDWSQGGLGRVWVSTA